MSSEVCKDPVTSNRSKFSEDLKSRYSCIHEPLSAADSAIPDNNQRYLTSLWVFGNREVEEESQSPLSASSSMLSVDQTIVDPQRIKEKVAAALKALSFREPRVLVQFWSPVAVRKRLLLTTLDQPFGLGMIDEGLYLYRLESEQRMFVVDEEHREESGPPGRAYRQKLPEWSLDIDDWAASHNIRGYINLPVFEPESGFCVGVLELITSSNYVDYAFEVQQISTALKGQNLKSPNVLEDTSIYARVGDEKRQLELDEILQALEMVCDTHNLPVAQTWGPCGYSSVMASYGNLLRSCSSFSKNCIGKVCMSTASLPFYVRDLSKWGFHDACKKRHLDKFKGVVGRSLSSRGLCYCGDVSQLSEDEYPLVHYARMHRITSCLAIYLKSIEGDDEYVVELFLPTQSANEEDLQSLVKTLKQHMKNASRIQLGDMSSPHLIGEIPLNWNLEFSTLTEKEEVPSELENSHLFAESEKNDYDVDVAFSKKQSEFAYTKEDNPSAFAAAGKRRENYIDSSNEPIRKRKITDVSNGLEEISKHFGKTFEEAADSLCVGRSTLKRICRNLGIHRWPYSSTFNANTSENYYAKVSDQRQLTNASMEEVCDSSTVEKINLLKEDTQQKKDSDTAASINTVTLNVRFEDSIVQFSFLLSEGLSNLENKVAKWFKIEGRRARLKYKDEDGDLILICDDDCLKSAMDTSGGKNLICKPDDM